MTDYVATRTTPDGRFSITVTNHSDGSLIPWESIEALIELLQELIEVHEEMLARRETKH